MSDKENKIRENKCIIIGKNNINIIGNAIEEYWRSVSHDAHTLSQINDTRILIKQLKDKKINVIKVCWG